MDGTPSDMAVSPRNGIKGLNAEPARRRCLDGMKTVSYKASLFFRNQFRQNNHLARAEIGVNFRFPPSTDLGLRNSRIFATVVPS